MERNAALDSAAERLGRLNREITGSRWERADLLLWIWRNFPEDYEDVVEASGLGRETARKERWVASKIPPGPGRPLPGAMSWSAVVVLAGLDPIDAQPEAGSAVPAAVAIARRAAFRTEPDARDLRDLMHGMDEEAATTAHLRVRQAVAALDPERPDHRGALRGLARRELQAFRAERGLDEPPDEGELADPTQHGRGEFVKAEVLRAVPGARRIRVLDRILEAAIRADRMWAEAQERGAPVPLAAD